MIIVSQDKGKIINFDNMTRVTNIIQKLVPQQRILIYAQVAIKN